MAVPLSTVEGLPYLGGNSPGFVSVDSSGLQRLKKSKLDAVADPTTLDDSGAGYAVGSRWVNTASGKVFELVDSSPLAAVWKDLTAVSPPAGSGTELQYRNGSNFGAVSGSSVSGGNVFLGGYLSAVACIANNNRWIVSPSWNGLRLTSGLGLRFTDGVSYADTVRVGVDLSGTAGVEINNGTAGQYRDLRLRQLAAGNTNAWPSNAQYAARFSGDLQLDSHSGVSYGFLGYGAQWDGTTDMNLASYGRAMSFWANTTYTGHPTLKLNTDHSVTTRSSVGIGLGLGQPPGYALDINGQIRCSSQLWMGGSVLVLSRDGSGNTVVDSNVTTLMKASGLSGTQVDGSLVAGETRFLLYDVDTAQLQRVLVGANGTGPGGVGRALYLAAA